MSFLTQRGRPATTAEPAGRVLDVIFGGGVGSIVAAIVISFANLDIFTAGFIGLGFTLAGAILGGVGHDHVPMIAARQ